MSSTRCIVVTGPPCSGKSHYVAMMRGPEDLVLDLDALHVALGSKVSHQHSPVFLKYALAARNGVLREWQGVQVPPRLWVIVSRVTADIRPLLPKAFHHTPLPTTREVCLQRCEADNRPHGTRALIEAWFAEQEVAHE